MVWNETFKKLVQKEWAYLFWKHHRQFEPITITESWNEMNKFYDPGNWIKKNEQIFWTRVQDMLRYNFWDEKADFQKHKSLNLEADTFSEKMVK